MFYFFKSPFYFIYFFCKILIFILINEQISPSTDGSREQAVYDLAEIIIIANRPSQLMKKTPQPKREFNYILVSSLDQNQMI